MLHDLKHAYRMLMQSKGWTVVVLLSLAIGIGATTALFTAVNGLLLQTIPIRDPQSLVDPEVDRQERHGPLVERLRLLAAAQRPERPQHVLQRDLPAAEGRQSDDDRSDRRHVARVVQLRVERQLGDRHRVRRVGQLLQGAGRVRDRRPDDRGVRRAARRRTGGGDQPRLLAAALCRRHRRSSARPFG